MQGFARWVGRNAVLYALLAAAFAFAAFAVPWIKSEWASGNLAADRMSITETRDAVDRLWRDSQARLDADAAMLRRAGAAELAAEQRRTSRDLAAARAELGDSGGFFASIRPSKIVARKRLELQIAALTNKLAAIDAAREAQSARALLDRAGRRAIPTASVVRTARDNCLAASEALAVHRRTMRLERLARNILEDRERRLAANVRDRCARWTTSRDRRVAGLAAYRAASARMVALEAWSPARLARPDLAVGERTIRDILVKAALALLLIVATPYLVRLLFYWVLAPIAERRPAIKLAVPGGSGQAIAPVPRSTISLPVRLRNGEELLVRQDFLQTTSQGGSKNTLALLDWRHPLSSLAAGLVFLTRVRGAGLETTVSAVRDPFAEIALLNLPPGAAAVLRPRNLVAVVQAIGRPLRITSHWRLFSLNAWLTLQLRYIVFHGPAGLVIQGGRGVRIERAEKGRVLGQAQLVGFSADLAYSVTRSETFVPYFLGREPLLKDRIEVGEGVLIVEEAPRASRAGGGRRKGLDGAFETLTNAVGL